VSRFGTPRKGGARPQRSNGSEITKRLLNGEIALNADVVIGVEYTETLIESE
jgi:hypothetical protein